ncbi:hypothetical protein [Clostridium thailandense]|uniref:hypothetical protein n=1 Tax=Clostridium thailandense TaxID=2794346 RepID=UPI003989D5C7
MNANDFDTLSWNSLNTIPDLINYEQKLFKKSYPYIPIPQKTWTNIKGYIYFCIVRHYLEYDINKKTSNCKDLIGEFYGCTKENKEYDSKRGEIDRIANKISKINSGYIDSDKYLKTGNTNANNLSNYYKFSQRQKLELMDGLKQNEAKDTSTYNTYRNILNNKYKKIKFKEYEDLVNWFKKEIEKSDYEFKNIRLYELEYYLNFEQLKNISSFLSLFDNKNRKKNIVKNLLTSLDIPDINNRIKCMFNYIHLKNADDIIDWIDGNYFLFSVICPAIINNIRRSMDYYYTKEQIGQLIEREKNFFMLIYMKYDLSNFNVDLNNVEEYILDYINDYYCSPIELIKFFKEENFDIVMEVLEEYNFYAKVVGEVVDDYNKKKSIPKIYKKYGDKIFSCNDYFEDTMKTQAFSDSNANIFKEIIEEIRRYKEIKKLSKTELKNLIYKDIENLLDNKTIASKYFQSDSNISRHRKKFREELMNTNNDK